MRLARMKHVLASRATSVGAAEAESKKMVAKSVIKVGVRILYWKEWGKVDLNGDDEQQRNDDC